MSERFTAARLNEVEANATLPLTHSLIGEIRLAWAERDRIKRDLDQIDGSRCLTDAIAKARREGAVEELEGMARRIKANPPPDGMADFAMVITSLLTRLDIRIAQLKEGTHGN